MNDDWAPYHVVQTDLPCAERVGKYFDLGIALGQLRSSSKHNPEHAYVIVYDGGILDEAAAEDLINRRATEKAKSQLKIWRQAA